MNCADALERITEYMEGSLPQAMQEQVRAHLSQCNACARAAEQVGQIAQSLRSLAPAEVPAGFQRRLNERLDRLTLFPLRRYLIPAAAAAVLVIASFGVMRVTQPVREGRGMAREARGPRVTYRAPVTAPDEREKGAPAGRRAQIPPLMSRRPQQEVKPAEPAVTDEFLASKPVPVTTPTGRASGAGSQTQRVQQGARPLPLPPLSREEVERRLARLSEAGPSALPRAEGRPAPVRRAAGGTTGVQPDVENRAVPRQEPPPPAPAPAGKAAAAPSLAAPTTPEKSKAVMSVEKLPESLAMPPALTAQGAPYRAGWLSSARVRLAAAGGRARAHGAQLLALDIQPQAAGKGADAGSLGESREVARARSHSVEIVAVPVRAARALSPGPAGPQGQGAPPQRQAVLEGTSNYIVLPNVGPAPAMQPQPSEVYNVTVLSEGGESRAFLLFVPPTSAVPGLAPPRQGRPVDVLAALTARAGVTLLTPGDLPTGYSIGVMTGRPEEALLTAIRALGLRVERDGRLWTAERP